MSTTQLNDKLRNIDADFRFMALNDLIGSLQAGSLLATTMDFESTTVPIVLNLIKDSNGEVQNMAVKAVAALARHVRESVLKTILVTLSDSLKNETESARDLAALTLKSVVAELPIDQNIAIAPLAVTELLPRLLALLIEDAPYELLLDILDIISEVLARFGGMTGSLQTNICESLVPFLNHVRPAVRKRASTALANISPFLNAQLFDQLMQKIVAVISSSSKPFLETLKTYLGALMLIFRTSVSQSSKYVANVLPDLLDHIKNDDDEIKELCTQCLEVLINQYPALLAPSVPAVINMCLSLIAYDPNYAASDDDDMEEETSEEDMDEDFDDDDVNFSDDDDCSWKVRRASVKLLASIFHAYPEMLDQFYRNVAPTLTRRIKEREESVRLDILNAWIALLRMTKSSDSFGLSQPKSGKKRKLKESESMETDDSPLFLLQQQAPNLVKILVRQMQANWKMLVTRQLSLTVIHELLIFLNGLFEPHLAQCLPPFLSTLGVATENKKMPVNTNSNLKMDSLRFLRDLFVTLPFSSYASFMERIVMGISSCANDKFYKLTAESLYAISDMMRAARPSSSPFDPTFKPFAQRLCRIAFEKAAQTDLDQEVKEAALICVTSCICALGPDIGQPLSSAVGLLMDRFKNEMTRLTTTKCLTKIISSEIGAGIMENQIPKGILEEACSNLRKTNRQLRVATVELLLACFKTFPVTENAHAAILSELTSYVVDTDLQLLPLAMNLKCRIIEAASSSAEVIQIVSEKLCPALFQLVNSSMLASSSAALHSTLTLLMTLTKYMPMSFDVLLIGLQNQIEVLVQANDTNWSKQSVAAVAQCVATVIMNAPSTESAQKATNVYITTIQNSSAHTIALFFAFHVLGELGRRGLDLSKEASVTNACMSFISSAKMEEVRNAASFTLGNLAIGNLQFFLPLIVNELKSCGAGDVMRHYMLLNALNQTITRYSSHENEAANVLQQYAKDIWDILFQSCDAISNRTDESKDSADKEEGTRNIIAESLGRLTLTDPSTFLQDLRQRLTSNSVNVRAVAIAAFKLTVSDTAKPDDTTAAYEDLIKPVIPDFLLLSSSDPDILVRRVALSSMNHFLHTKPSLIKDHLETLMPCILNETKLREDLIQVVSMGPFTHKVDGGLDARKTAIECLYTLLDTPSLLTQVNVNAMVGVMIQSLRDPAQEVQILSHLTWIKASHLHHTPSISGIVTSIRSPSTPVSEGVYSGNAMVVSSFMTLLCSPKTLDDMTDPLRVTLTTKLKDTAVKQEIEKQAELMRSVLRCIAAVCRLVSVRAQQGGSKSSGGFTGTGSVKMDALVHDIKTTFGMEAQWQAILSDLK